MTTTAQTVTAAGRSLPPKSWNRFWRMQGQLPDLEHRGGKRVTNTRLTLRPRGKTYAAPGQQEAARRHRHALWAEVVRTTKRLPHETTGHLKRRLRRVFAEVLS